MPDTCPARQIATAVAATSALALLQSASANVVSGSIQTGGYTDYSGFDVLSAVPIVSPPSQTYSYDLNGDTITDITGSSAKSSEAKYPKPGSEIKDFSGVNLSASSETKLGGPVAAGATVDGSLTYSANATVAYSGAPSSAYYAIRLGTVNNYHYGYIQFTQGTSTTGVFDLLNYSYESNVNTAVNVPAATVTSTAVPAPTALSALAFGAAAMMKRRNRQA